MKRFLLLALASLCVSTVYASNTALNSEMVNQGLLSWSITDPHFGYGLFNTTNHQIKMRVLVANKFDVNNRFVNTDVVTFRCNGKNMYIMPGHWETCMVQPNHDVSVDVDFENFRIGAAGLFEVIDTTEK